MQRLKFGVCAVLAGALLAGCAGGATAVGGPYKVYGDRFSPRYSHGDLQFFNGDKEMLVEVVNAPYDGDRNAAAQTIAQSMRGKNQATRIDFTSAAGPETPDQTRIVVAFHTETSDSGSAYCGSPAPANQAREGDTVRMLMVYCKRDEFMSSIRAEVNGADRIGDASFQQMLAQATKRLIPLQDPFNENRGKKKRTTG